MQEQSILSFLAYVWALGIVPTTTSVSADRNSLDSEQDEAKLFDADAIKTEAELQAALSDPETVAITLASDIITLENLVVNRNDSIELNLNGFKIASLSENARVIDVQAGDIAILGLGSIVATGTGASAVRVKGAITADNVNYSHVLIGADVTLYAPNYYGIFVTTSYNAAYGVTIDFYGSIIAHDGICIHGNIGGRGDNVPHINLQDGAKIIADENKGSAICAFGNGIWEIGTAEVNGGTGLNVKAGTINLRQTSVIATGDDDILPGGGAAIRFEDNFAHRIKLKIFSGSCLSVQGYAFYEHVEQSGTSSLNSLEIYDGIFSGQLGICFGIAPRGSESSSTRIYGGKFSADVNQYLAPEHHVEPDPAHGEYTVIDDTEPTQVIDKAAQIGFAKADLEDLISIAERYTKPSYAGNELGELQVTVNKIISSIKRAIKASKKLLESSDLTLAKIKSSTRRLEDHLSEIRSIEDGMRAEISEAIKFSKIDQSRYTSDSFLDLSLAAADAEQLLAADFVTLVELQDMLGVIDAAKIMLEESEDYVDSPDEIDTILEDAAEPIIESSEIEEQSSEAVDLETEVEIAPDLSAEQPPLPEDLPLPELPLRPAPKLFPALPEAPSTTDVKQVLESFVDAEATEEDETEYEEEELTDPIEAAFAIDDLEMEEMAEVEEFVDQLKMAQLIAEPIPDLPEIVEEEFPTPTMEKAPALATQPEPPVPVFIDPETLAAKQSLRDLLNAISALDPADYTVESYTILARTATMAGNLLSENAVHATTAVLTSAFSSVTLAYERLAKKTENPTNTALEAVELNLRSMLDAVQDLTVNDYETSSAEQFGELQVAIAKAKAMLTRDLPNLNDILGVMDEIKLATSGLKGVNTTQPEPVRATTKPAEPVATPAVENSTFIVHQQPATQTAQSNNLNWNDFREVLNDIRALNADEYTSESYQKLLAALENAKVISNKANLTQAEVDEMVFELNLAMLALERPNAPRLSTTQDFSQPVSSPQNPAIDSATTNQPIGLATDDTITPSLLMSMMAGAYAGLATYRRSRLEAKKRKQLRSA